MGTIFMNNENRKTSEPHKFALEPSQRLDLKSSDKHVALQNMSIHYTWKNIRKQYKNIKLKVMAPTWNDIQIFKIIFHLSFKSLKHLQQFLLYMFTSI